jgi:N-acetylmuramoyl-L-alanine amidase
MIQIIQRFLTNNLCFQKGVLISPTGIMLHSTACPGVPPENFVSSWNVPMPNNRKVCVNGFIKPGVVYQTLPWNMRSWHCGGLGNNTNIGFEICEPKNYADKKYFLEVKQTALELCAYLCNKYNISVARVTSHCEGYRNYGSVYASNHGDLDHWWKKSFNYTMDDFRMELVRYLKKEEEEMVCNTIEELPSYAAPTIQKLVDKGYLKGNEKGLDINETMVRLLVILDRAGNFDN